MILSKDLITSIKIKKESINLEDLKSSNIYYIIGNAYAGKSTMCKCLADKYDGILCGENYHNYYLDDLDKNEFPNLCYTRDLQDWHDFIRRSPDEYARWISDVSKECEIIELQLLKELIKYNKKIFVDTNISIETLKKISDKNHVIVMLADPNESVNLFFEREDREKQFLYQLIMEEENTEHALNNFRECLKRINSEEDYNQYLHSGFNVIKKDKNRTIEETVEVVSKLFKLKD
ncbi:MAG: hypothetical protein K6E74_05685 [Bacilli bacterium]|nr:hypothetical protein [Bacilli bacterium]